MKTRIIIAILASLLILSACVTHPAPVSYLRKDARTPMAAGHYSLVYLTAVGATRIHIPVTGQKTTWQDFFSACNGRLDSIHPRFGRSLRYECRNK